MGLRPWRPARNCIKPKSDRKFQIANGRSIDLEGEWPWLSMLIKEGSEDQYDAQVQCVGVLINCNTVLTTASCAKHSQGLFLYKIAINRPKYSFWFYGTDFVDTW